MIETIYGKKKERASRFIITAPHGAGDDLKTGLISKRLAKALGGSFVINYKYKKPENSINKNLDLVEDFNHLRWAFIKNKFLWSRKKLAMKEFYLDIAKICDKIKIDHQKKAVVVYIHGMKSKEVGIDVGTGLRSQGSKLFGSGYHIKTGGNTGEVTTKISQAKKIFKIVKENLQKDFNLDVTAGEAFSGWSKCSGIQFHKHQGRNDYAIQIEINDFLRADNEKINYTVNLLAKTLKEVFK